MPLTDNLKEAAQVLAEAIRAHQSIEQYLLADAALQADPETRDLDQRYQAMYDNLVARQRAGDSISQDELDDFYALQVQVRDHPLLQDRSRKLTVAKGFLRHLGADLNQKLGLDYVTLVLS